HRGQFLHLAAGAAALPVLSRFAWAQAYPSRPVRLIVGWPPGGPAHLFARLIGQPLSERLGQPMIIENRPRAASHMATQALGRAPPDGYTLRTTRRSTTSSISISSATSRRSRASTAAQGSWWYTRRSQRSPFPN